MENYKIVIINILVAFLTLPAGFCDIQPPIINPDILTQTKNLGECQACKIFIESFKQGLERTSRGKYEGGDADWEEEKLKKSYKHSEMRLIDIQEGLCKEERKHSVQCHHMAEKAEIFIEEWWSEDPDESTDLYTYICIEKLLVCCPKHHFGKYCTPCPGDHEKLCSGNGKCRGDGTRKGNGTCLCDPGYTGDECDQCSVGYYLAYKDDSKMLCSPCHKSCMGGCRHGTQKDCVACRPGFEFDTEKGCLDINECNVANKCKENQYCLNSLGSYTCVNCDGACNECHGHGPDMCKRCSKGYIMMNDICVKSKEEEDYASEMLTSSRYMSYVGLLIVVGIVLPSSTPLGSVVAALVLTYIVGAEYYCMINGYEGLVDLKNFDLFRLFYV